MSRENGRFWSSGTGIKDINAHRLILLCIQMKSRECLFVSYITIDLCHFHCYLIYTKKPRELKHKQITDKWIFLKLYLTSKVCFNCNGTRFNCFLIQITFIVLTIHILIVHHSKCVWLYSISVHILNGMYSVLGKMGPTGRLSKYLLRPHKET